MDVGRQSSVMKQNVSKPGWEILQDRPAQRMLSASGIILVDLNGCWALIC